MSQISETLEKLLSVEGAMAAALVDYNTGMLLGSVGSGVDMEIAAAGNTEVVRSKMRTIGMLDLNQDIEDILITLSDHYHMIRPLKSDRDLFIYYVLDNKRANLALARITLKKVETGFDF